MQIFGSWEEIEAFDDLTPAEQLLKSCTKQRLICCLGDMPTPPVSWSDVKPDRCIRAHVLRFVLLGHGSDETTPASGIKLSGAIITGQLDMSHLHAHGRTAFASCLFQEEITATQASFESLILNQCALPKLDAPGMRISGQLSCNGTVFSGIKGVAVNLQNARIGDSVFLGEGFIANGTADLSSATVDGQVDCHNAKFDGQGAFSLSLNGANITDGVFLREHSEFLGTVDLSSVTIGGQLGLNKSHFVGCNEECAILAQSATVGASLHASDGFIADDPLSFQGMQIGGQVNFSGAQCLGKSPFALSLEMSSISGDVLLGHGFKSSGEINFHGAKIFGQVNFTGGTFYSNNNTAINFSHSQIKKGFFFRGVSQIDGLVNLGSASVGVLVDDAESWPNGGALYLDGLTYDRLAGSTTIYDSASRLRWLEKGDTFEGQFFPHPYSQLAKVLKEMGHEREAREVRVALARKLAEENLQDIKKSHAAALTPPPKLGVSLAAFYLRIRYIWVWLLDFMFRNVVGYGFKPVKSIYWLVGLIAVAWFLALGAWQTGQFTPNSAPILVSKAWTDLEADPKAAITWSKKGNAGQDWETFDPLAYAADIVIPIVEIGQTSAWAPSPARGAWGWTLWWMRWVFTAAGWIISALGAAAITGVIRRE